MDPLLKHVFSAYYTGHSRGIQKERLGDDDRVPHEEGMQPGQGAALHHVGKAHAAEVVRASSATPGEEVRRAENQNGREPGRPESVKVSQC